MIMAVAASRVGARVHTATECASTVHLAQCAPSGTGTGRLIRSVIIMARAVTIESPGRPGSLSHTVQGHTPRLPP
jgi:hypothetical protein